MYKYIYIHVCIISITNISHLEKKAIIFKSALVRDLLVLRRVVYPSRWTWNVFEEWSMTRLGGTKRNNTHYPPTRPQDSSIFFGGCWTIYIEICFNPFSCVDPSKQERSIQKKNPPTGNAIGPILAPKQILMDKTTLLWPNKFSYQPALLSRWFFFSPGGICDRSLEGTVDGSEIRLTT